MRIKNLLTEDDAVSPVIGVILMVAITVILAAVIASFVLGLGDTADEVQPTTSFNFDYDNTDEELTITIADGDAITAENLWVRGELNSTEGEAVDFTWAEEDPIAGVLNDDNDAVIEGTGGYDIADDDEISAGQGIVISNAGDDDDLSEYDISVVWDTGDDSSTLDSSEGPDA